MANNVNNDVVLDKSKFKLVENCFQDSEKMVGKSLGYWADSMRRLFKNKLATFCLGLLIFIYAFSIYVTLTSPYDTVIEPQIPDPNKPGEMISKAQLTKLPPRIKGLEWIPWFSGSIKKEIAKANFEDPFLKGKYKEGTYEILSCEVDRYDVEMCVIKQDMYKQNNIKQLYFNFGTDEGARDLWTRVWFGIRSSITIALITAFFDIVVGTIYGAIAGYFAGSKLDDIMMRFTEIYGSIPSIVLLILILSFMQRGFGSLIIAMVLTGWLGVARMIRAQFLRYRDHDFVLASKTIGASNKRLIFKHILPNIVGQIVVLATFSIPGAIFYEATLSFVGLGLPTELSSLGDLINKGISARIMSPYLLWIPTILLGILMLAINLLANGLRDSLDPRLRGE